MDGYTDRQIARLVGGQISREMDGWMDGWINRQTDR
jgi:hypothetical protein